MESFFDGLAELWNLTLFNVPNTGTVSLGQLILIVALVVLGYVVSRIIEYIFGRKLKGSSLRPDAVHTIKRLLFYVLLVGVFMTALALLKVPLAAFAFVSGAIAIGVGFGAQNIINNLISGWILMAERPIRVGDFVEIDGGQGVVELIGNRSTRIRRSDGVHMLVPNSQLLEKTVINWTLVDQEIRAIVRVGVAYGSPVDDVIRLLLEATDAEPEVKDDPPPTIIFEDFGDNSLVFDAYFWCDVSGDRSLRVIKSSIRTRMSSLLTQNGIVVAFPQRDVHLDIVSPIPISLSDGQRRSVD